jgi:hypothetical protein
MWLRGGDPAKAAHWRAWVMVMMLVVVRLMSWFENESDFSRP